MKIIMKGQTIEGTPEEIISMLKLIDAPAKPIARKGARQKDVETMREKRAIMCKHPFLKYYNDHICRLEYDDGVDFDYDAAISKIRITRRGRLKRLFKRMK